MIPPAEIRKAITCIIQTSLGATRDEAACETVRLFGLNRTGAKLRQVIERQIQWMLDEKLLHERNEKLYVNESRLG